MELVHISGGSWYVPGPVNLGVYECDGEAVLIDSGNDGSAGRKLLRLVQEQGWTVKMIVNTHSNADHVGGNAFIQKRTGCSIAATPAEAAFTERPVLEPSLLWGAVPFRAIRSKFLEAPASAVTHRIKSSGPVLDTGLEATPLPGHFLEMIGLRTPDGVFYIADSLFSEEILEKYGMTVCFDVTGQLETLDMLEKAEARMFVPCHAPVSEDISSLARANRDALLVVAETVREACGSPSSREDVLALLAERFSIKLTPAQYVLTHITVSAHISRLADRGELEPLFEKGRMLWRA